MHVFKPVKCTMKDKLTAVTNYFNFFFYFPELEHLSLVCAHSKGKRTFKVVS